MMCFFHCCHAVCSCQQ